MNIVCLKETKKNENRVALTPQSATGLQKLGFECAIQKDAGKNANLNNSAYKEAGVNVINSLKSCYEKADILLKVNPPTQQELTKIKAGTTLICHFYPGDNDELMTLAAKHNITIMAMDMVPRISRAQKMDALSSMANIAGYRAVIEAANRYGHFLNGQITAAGKVPPAKILIIGAGVAGLAAIGAAVSLGAIVYAFDVRPEVAEQIESLGGEFLYLDFTEDASTSSGYAAPSSPEFQAKQLELFRSIAPDMDIVITTALIPGRDAPRLWLSDMVAAQKPGSVVIDLAAERGGNCDLTKKDEVISSDNHVTIVGYTDFPSRMATQASNLYATNIRHLIHDLSPEKDGQVVHNMDDDIIRSVTVTKDGEVTYPPPAPKVQANVKPQTVAQETPAQSEEEIQAQAQQKKKKQGFIQMGLIGAGTVLLLSLGQVAPAQFMQHFSVFLLACFIGYQVIWNVSHSLHTPLMAVTNAISGIIIIGALLQLNTGHGVVTVLASLSVLIATINITGGFYVTRRMLQMFQKSH